MSWSQGKVVVLLVEMPLQEGLEEVVAAAGLPMPYGVRAPRPINSKL